MAKKKRNIPKPVEATIPRMRMGEVGSTGLKQVKGLIYEEDRPELRFPRACRTFRVMAKDPTIYSALQLFEMMISGVEWEIDQGINPDAGMNERAEFLRQNMDDMEHSWYSFIREVTSAFTYGFSVHEMVFRRRYFNNGSKYNDGRLGIHKLPVRSQDTITEWLYTEDGRTFLGCVQDVNQVAGGNIRYSKILQDGGKVELKNNKILLFRVDPKRDNPEGNSPLRACYDAWLYRKEIEDQEAVGVTRDMNGMPTLYIPPAYMAEDADESKKAVYEYYQRVIRNIQMNEQSGLILPQAFDPESKQPLFKFELTSTQGGKLYNTDAIIRRWDNKILQALFADMLKLGQDQVGSYNLAGAKTNIMVMAIESRLREIQDVLNTKLIPTLFRINGVKPDVPLPKLKYGKLGETDLDELSKAIQRMGSVGALERDRELYNFLRKAIGINPKADDEEVDVDNIMGGQSQAGKAGLGNGASGSAAGRDNAAANNA